MTKPDADTAPEFKQLGEKRNRRRLGKSLLQSELVQRAGSALIGWALSWTWRANRERGFKDKDIRRDTFAKIGMSKPEDLVQFQHEKVKGRKFTWLVLGDRQSVDFKYLKKIGKVQELSLEEIFGY